MGHPDAFGNLWPHPAMTTASLSGMLWFLWLNTSTSSILLSRWNTLVPGHPLGPVMNTVSVWGTGTDCKGHLVLRVWHVLTRVPTAASSSSPRGGDSRVEQLNWWLLCGWDRKQCMRVLGGLPISSYGCEIVLYFHCNQDLWEPVMCLMWMQHYQCCQHRLTPMPIFRCVSWRLSIVSWTRWQDRNVSNLLLAAAWEICGQSFMALLLLLHSSSSASSRCCLDDSHGMPHVLCKWLWKIGFLTSAAARASNSWTCELQNMMKCSPACS